MGVVNRAFSRSLYEEHLEEVSSLYELRRQYLDDTEVGPEDVWGLEARIEAHLDALVVGGDLALELCAERSLEGDAGSLFGAVCVFCRQGRSDLFEAALARFDEEEPAEPAPPSTDEGEDDRPIEEIIASTAAELSVEVPTEDEDDEPDAAEDADAEDADAEDDDAEDDDAEDDDDDDDGEATPAEALADALAAEGPAPWQPLFESLLEQGRPSVVAAVARMAAVRGMRLGPALVATGERLEAGPALVSVLWALGRMRERSAGALLSRWARQPELEEGAASTLALLRHGDPSMLDFVGRAAPQHPWAVSMLAIAGGPAVGPTIQARLARPEATADEIIAAGLFGDPTVVPRLQEALSGPHPEAAAQALYLVTGAPVFETVEQEVEEADALGPMPNGEPDPRDTIEIERLSQDPEAWRQWWQEHWNAFTAGRRHRLGQPASPEILARTLHAFVLRQPVRQLAAEEVGLRYWPQRDLDVDQWAGPQQVALAGLSALRQSDAVIARGDGAWLLARARQQ